MTRVKSLGTSLKGKDRLIWRDIEKNAFEGDENYIPFSPGVREGEEREFFILMDGEEKIGRACTTVDRGWIEKRKENIGFIDDFAILPDYKEDANLLIKHCLSVLKDKGLEGAFVRRSPLFPGLLVDAKEPPTFLMPYNPSFYIDLFAKEGFTREKEWVEVRLKFPSKLTEELPPIFSDKKIKKRLFFSKDPKDFQEHKEEVLNLISQKQVPESVVEDTSKSYRFIEKNDARIVRINAVNVKEMKELSAFESNIFMSMEHFGYNPREFMGEGEVTFLKRLQLRFLNYLLRIKTLALRGKDGNIIGYVTYLADLAAPMKKMREKKGLRNLFRFRRLMRKNDSFMIGGLGIDENIRGMGAVRSLVFVILKIMVDDGVRTLTTGPMLADNIPVMKTVEIIGASAGIEIEPIKYVTLSYKF